MSEPFKTGRDTKLRVDLVPPESIEAYAEILQYGINMLKEKGVDNPERNWEKGFPMLEVHYASAMRHLLKWAKGIDLDEESGKSHIFHALFWIAGLAAQIKRDRVDLDDRPVKEQEIEVAEDVDTGEKFLVIPCQDMTYFDGEGG